MVDEISYVVRNLENAEFNPVRQGGQYDYGFSGGGMLNTFEYLRSLSTYEMFQNLVPEKIFSSGPHSATELKLTEKYSFGYYNPRFVNYFHEGVKQLISDEAFVASTHGMMEEFGFIYKLSKLREIYRFIDKNNDEFNQLKAQYQEMLVDQTWPTNGYRNYLPANFDNDYYWNWAETAYYFWVRREIDNTKELWIGVIDDLLHAYPMVEQEQEPVNEAAD